MSNDSRREVFTSLISRFGNEAKSVLRPPYNSNTTLFHTVCPDCKETPCATLCEEEIIKIDKNNQPFIHFGGKGCTFCEACAKACSYGVLSLENVGLKKIPAKASIQTATCLAWNEVMCSACLDACDERAISFFGVFRPIVDELTCTACGFCEAVCPVDAIEFQPLKEK